MTYIESALYDFIKSIMTKGIRTLKDRRYFAYSGFLLIIVFISTISAFLNQLTDIGLTDEQMDLLLYFELSAAVAYVITGIIFGRAPTGLQMIVIFALTGGGFAIFYLEMFPTSAEAAIIISGSFYLIWIAITSFSTFALFRDLFENKVFGTILFLGKPEDDGKVMFSLIGWVLVFANGGMGYFILNKGMEQGSQSLAVTGLIIIVSAIVAALPLLNLQRKHDVFFTILTAFYMFTTIRIVLLAFRILTASPGQTSYWDTIFALFMALYTIQSTAARGIQIGIVDDKKLSVEEKAMADASSGFGTINWITRIMGDRGLILFILGTVMGFHTTQVQSISGRQNIFNAIPFTQDADIVLLGYEVNLLVTFVIYILALFLFLVSPGFRRYANPEVKRIPWAPPYEDLKLLVTSIKEGEIDWKADALKLISGMAMDKVREKLGKKSGESRIKSTLDTLIGRAKEEKKK